jgi:hypothetical protein
MPKKNPEPAREIKLKSKKKGRGERTPHSTPKIEHHWPIDSCQAHSSPNPLTPRSPDDHSPERPTQDPAEAQARYETSRATFEVLPSQPVGASIYAARIARGFRRPSRGSRRRSSLVFCLADSAAAVAAAAVAAADNNILKDRRKAITPALSPVSPGPGGPPSSTAGPVKGASPLPPPPPAVRCGIALPTLAVTADGVRQQAEEGAITERHLPGVGRLRIRRQVINLQRAAVTHSLPRGARVRAHDCSLARSLARTNVSSHIGTHRRTRTHHHRRHHHHHSCRR